MTDYLIPGRMPLPVAWVVATIGTPFLLIFLSSLSEDGTAVDEMLLLGLLVLGVTTSIVVARLKGRSVRIWAILAGLGIWATFLFFGPLFQPVTVAVAVALAKRLPPTLQAASAAPVRSEAQSLGTPAGNDQPSPAAERPEYNERDTPGLDQREDRSRLSPAKPFRQHRRSRR